MPRSPLEEKSDFDLIPLPNQSTEDCLGTLASRIAYANYRGHCPTDGGRDREDQELDDELSEL
jgi:hypothetical protein